MRLHSFLKLLLSLPILLFALLANGQTTFTYQFSDGQGTACAPASVNFSPQTNLSNPSYTWQVNGVTFSQQNEPVRIFPVGGVYTICVEAQDPIGTVETHCEQIFIFDPPTVELVSDVDLGCSPLLVNFTLNSSTLIDSIIWDLGDGSVFNESGTGQTSMMLTHTFTNAGNFSPLVTIFDENGCKVTTSLASPVQVINTPQPAFNSDESIGCTVPHTVNFNNITPMNGNLSFQWDFGVNNQTSTDVNPSFTYDNLGSYDVTLIVTNDDTQCSDTLLLEDFVNIGEFGGFQYEVFDNGDCSSTEVGFSFYSSGNVQSVNWDFGDGNTSNQINPIHNYTFSGCFFPSLTIVTTDGCTYNSTASDCINVNGPVLVNYTVVGDTVTCDEVNGTTVSFSGNSLQAQSWFWDFGGLGTSDEQNPTFTFTGIGSYPVTLTVTYSDGCTESITNTTIEIGSIEAAFSSDVEDGCEGLEVNFTNETDPVDPIISYQWDFDGGTGLNTLENPTVVFSNAGTYDITLIVETVSGCIDTTVMEDFIAVGTLTGPGFSANMTNACLEDDIEFTSDPNPLIDEWEWKFGDGGQSGEENPDHEYQDTGFFEVTLITFYNGCSDTLAIEDYIYINAPKAEFSYLQDCNSLGEIQFFDESAGAETWAWDFGDGGTANIPNPSHSYSSNGAYLVSLTVTNAASGCTHTEFQTVNVTNSAPEFTLSDLNICIGDTLSVINSSTGADCYTWSFPFGVGMITDSFCDEDPAFYFPAPGAYTGFCLTISDGSNCVNTFCLQDTVFVSGVIADFSIDPNDENGCAPETVLFSNSSYGVNGDVESYTWDFGDGSFGVDENPFHLYSESGYFSVSLVAANESGCVDSLTVDSLIFMDNVAPFFIPQISDCTSQEVNFTNGTTAYDLNDLTYLWEFGDGNTSTDPNPTHNFGSVGTYNVCLTASNASGCVEQFCEDVAFQPLIAEFVADETYKSCPEPPLISNFMDQSTNAITWFWDFGDGGTSSLQNPSHSYNQVGTYDVCLTVTNVLGCAETICKTAYIEVAGPSGTVTASPLSGCADHEVEFIVQSENAFRYTWDFGDGIVIDTLASGNTDTISHTYTIGGTFTPVVLVEDISGCQVPITVEQIFVEDLFSDFLSNVNEVCAEAQTPIDFLAAFNDPPAVISVNWEFPGSNTPTATGDTPAGIVYSTPGYYDVIVHVNTTYCQTTVTKDSFIYVHAPPVTDFTYTPSIICNTETVTFESTSTADPDTVIAWNWTIENNTYTDSVISHQFTSPGTYTVTLETISDFGCVSSTQQTITVNEIPTVEAGDDVFICLQETAPLNASVQIQDPVTFSWSPINDLSCADCPDPIASPAATTMYYVTATSSSGCTSVDSVQVEVSTLPQPEVIISPDTTICEGESVTISADLNQQTSSWSWDSASPGLTCYTCPTPAASPTETTTYYVTIFTPEGCSASDSLTVTVISSEDLIDGSPAICFGDSVQLQIDAGTNVLWQPATGLSCADCPNPMASPDSTTIYSVTALVAGQCTITDEITVTVVTDDLIEAGEDQTVCDGDSITLTGNYPPVGTSEWVFNGNTVATNEPTPTIMPTENGDYILIVDVNGCELRDTMSVEIIERAEIFAEDIIICQGDTAFLTVMGDADTYLWFGADGLSDPNSATPWVIPNETTTYLVAGALNGCTSDTLEVNVEVVENPEITMPPVQFFDDGDPIQVEASVSGNGNLTYSWSPATDLSCTNCLNPTATLEDDATYTLTVTNETGCLDTASTTLRRVFICHTGLIHVPNAFSPNDDGNNDRFNVWSDLEITTVRIYNRWGELLFEDKSGQQGWDGTYKGKKLNRDVFIYYIEAYCEFNRKTLVKTGDVTLVR
ncbi:MAG: PKD domain-containing protein [Bacteroidota bacterium]